MSDAYQHNASAAHRRSTPTPPAITIEAGNLYADRVGPEGITREELAALAPQAARAHRRVCAGSVDGLDAEFACLNLAHEMSPALAEIRQTADALRAYRDLVLVGIGGSSLGTKAICQAIAQDARAPRLHFVENIDPHSLDLLLARLNPAATAVLCISKSGGTIETVVQFLVLRDWLKRSLGSDAARRHQWVITDPQTGWLRALAARDNLPALPVPPKVGGRYSVLSPVGLLPLAAVGVDIEALLKGAAENAARCVGETPATNAALEIAALCYLLDTSHSKRIAVMMPYVNRLQLFVDWYCQLWAESLGKWDRTQPGRAPAGTLPVRAMGAIDQHSQLQMYLESRHDKFFTFIELAAREADLPVPLDEFDAQHFPYLASQSMTDVIAAEFQATRQVITDAGHPNMTLRLPVLDAHVLGQLIDLYQRATIYTGLLYGINPLDQPSVEKGKRLAIQYLRDAQHG